MKKKAQLTMFILIGVFILLVAGVSFYLLTSANIQNDADESSVVAAFVESCVDLVADDALLVLGKQGGKELGPVFFEELQTSYLYLNGINAVPEKEEVEQFLSSYIENNLNLCLKDFDNLKKRGITIQELQDPVVSTSLTDNNVFFTLNYLLKEKINSKEIRHENFKPTIKNLKLKNILEASNSIVLSRIRNDGMIDLELDTELDITFFPLDKTLVTVIKDTSYLIDDQPYTFVFAHKD